MIYKLVTAGCVVLSMTSMVNAGASQCPDVSSVLSALPASDKTISIQKLGEQLGTTLGAGEALYPLANRIKQELPGVQDALVEDVMIAAYCQYLSSTAQSGSEQSALITRFETLTNDAVYSAPSTEAKSGGWLYN